MKNQKPLIKLINALLWIILLFHCNSINWFRLIFLYFYRSVSTSWVWWDSMTPVASIHIQCVQALDQHSAVAHWIYVSNFMAMLHLGALHTGYLPPTFTGDFGHVGEGEPSWTFKQTVKNDIWIHIMDPFWLSPAFEEAFFSSSVMFSIQDISCYIQLHLSNSVNSNSLEDWK